MVKSLIDRLNIRKQDMADYLGVSNAMVCHLYDGKNELTLHHINKLAPLDILCAQVLSGQVEIHLPEDNQTTPEQFELYRQEKLATLQRRLDKLRAERDAIEEQHTVSGRAYQFLTHIANHPDQFTNIEHAWITLQQSRNKKRFLESTEIRKRELDAMIKGVEAEMEEWVRMM